MEFHHLKSILHELNIRVEHRNYPHEFELKRELHYLNENERRLLKKRIVIDFQQQNFSQGNLRVIKILKDANIINMCDYLRDNSTNATEIINLLIDQPIENLNLFEEMLSSDVFYLQVIDCLRQYFQELIDHPEWNRIEMISSTYDLISKSLYQNTILKPCIEFLLKYKESELINAISKQKQWNEMINFEGIKFFDIFKMILPIHADFIVSEIINAIDVEESVNWFFILKIVNLFPDHNDFKSELINLNFDLI